MIVRKSESELTTSTFKMAGVGGRRLKQGEFRRLVMLLANVGEQNSSFMMDIVFPLQRIEVVMVSMDGECNAHPGSI
jgi:hypothetical protein